MTTREAASQAGEGGERGCASERRRRRGGGSERASKSTASSLSLSSPFLAPSGAGYTVEKSHLSDVLIPGIYRIC